MSNNVLLDVRNLKLHFRTRSGPVQAVDGVSFQLREGHTLAVVGESGCGKTSLAKAILRLLPRNVTTFSGSVIFEGQDIMKYDDEKFRREIRWSKIAMVPQASMNSLNPVIRIEDQLMEPLLIHENISKQEAAQRVRDAFAVVGLPVDFLARYPFELSGGMRQRAAIAMALAPAKRRLGRTFVNLGPSGPGRPDERSQEGSTSSRLPLSLITHDIGFAIASCTTRSL